MSHRLAMPAQRIGVTTPLAPPDGHPVQTPATSARLSREHEKNQIASLNKRFAAIIERNKRLESENKMLKQRKSQLDETAQRTKYRYKSAYEKELAEIRAKGEVLTGEVAELRVVHTELELKYNEKKTELDGLTKAETPKKRQLIEMKKQVEDLTSSIQQVQFESRQILAEKNNLEQDLETLPEEVDLTKEVLEKETEARQDTQSGLKRKIDELKIEDQRHQEELEEIESQHQYETKCLEEELRQQYEHKLQETLGGLRAEYDQKLQESNNALETRRGEMGFMKTQLRLTQDELHNLNVETLKSKGQMDAAQKMVTDFENEKREMLQAIENLEKKSVLDHTTFRRMLKDKDEIIDAQVAEKEALVDDTQLLMSAKTALGNEIKTFRILLDGADSGLAAVATSSTSVAPGSSPVAGSSTSVPVPLPQFTFPPKS